MIIDETGRAVNVCYTSAACTTEVPFTSFVSSHEVVEPIREASRVRTVHKIAGRFEEQATR